MACLDVEVVETTGLHVEVLVEGLNDHVHAVNILTGTQVANDDA
jgi:hypothetical protein